MSNFFSRIFRSRSLSRDRSEPSFHQSSSQSFRTNSSANVTRSASSIPLSNLGSYSINARDLEKYKLHKAAWDGKSRKVQNLARSGQVDIRDQQSRTPLHLAVVKGNLEVVQHLIDAGAQLNFRDSDGRTPLVKAILSGTNNPQRNLEICRVLIRARAGDFINLPDQAGKTALHYAIEYSDEKLIELLLSTNNCDLNIQDRDQMGALHLAVKKRRTNVLDALLSETYQPPADLNLTNHLGQTPLHMAATLGVDDIIRSLLLCECERRPKCDPTIVDSQQNTAYAAALANHKDSSAKIIREYEEKIFKPGPTSTSLHEQSSFKATSSITLTPAANRQLTANETSDDSSSITTQKSLKPQPIRPKRSSDQWSDENGSSNGALKAKSAAPGAQNLSALLRANPLQPKISDSSTSKSIKPNPPQPSTTQKPTTSQPASFFGIGPVVDRLDSDDTSPTSSLTVKPISKPINAIVTNPILPPVTKTNSWSDHTVPKPIPLVKKSTPISDTWDSTSLTQSDDDETGAYKAKKKTPVKAPVVAPTTLFDSTDSESDQDSVETEIRKPNLPGPSTAPTTTTNIVQKPTGTGYKVVKPREISSPVSDESSWTSPVEPITISKIIHEQPLAPRSQSTWDDSRPLSGSLKSKHSEDRSQSTSSTPTTENPTTSPKSRGKLLTSSLIQRSESNVVVSPPPPPPIIEEEEEESAKTTIKSQPQPAMRSSIPQEKLGIRPSTSSSSSSFQDQRVVELRESIRKIEQNQEDTRELKRQLNEMEKKKNEFESLCRQNERFLQEIEKKLEQEKSEKLQWEWKTKTLNLELEHIQDKLQLLEQEKERLSQRCEELRNERDRHDQDLRRLQTSETLPSDENNVDQLHHRHREQLKNLSAVNGDLHDRTKQLESDLDVHRQSLDLTLRYKIDLEKTREEKFHYQQEYDRLKHEKELLAQEKLQYQIKYDCLQEEIRTILLDRSKLEQQLTSELQEQIQQRQQTKDDLQRYKYQVEQVNMKLLDAEARLTQFQSQNQSVTPVKTTTRVPSEPLEIYVPEQKNLIESSEKLRSDTLRVTNELNYLRDNFDRLVSAYEPASSSEQQARLHSHIDIFRQYYEHEYRQRQALMSKTTTTTTTPSRFYQGPIRSVSQTTFIPRRASAFLTINTDNSNSNVLRHSDYI